MPDHVTMVKKLKNEAKEKKAKFKNANYDADFDPDLLEEG